jgi:hypothetical protein
MKNRFECKRCGRSWETWLKEPKACRWCGAQSEIITTIGKLGSKDKADRVMQAINCLVRADQLVPGILAQFIRGQEKP